MSVGEGRYACCDPSHVPSHTDAYHPRLDSITGAAGAGFRLSLVLNAVKMKMQNADVEIQKISKAISDFSLMLKQVAVMMQEGGVTPTPLAVDTVFDIKGHSERIFEEIKSMTELAQIRDEKGNLTEIGIGQKVVWCFKKQKVPYLLGQLEYLRLNLSIMLQILQLAKTIAPTKYVIVFGQLHSYVHTNRPRPCPSDKFMMQERAEIQNMIVLQHWSLEELNGLFGVANDEVRQDTISPTLEDPPPRYDDPASDEVRLAITAPPRPPKVEETSQAMVQYQERPLHQLDEALHQALCKENQVLNASVPDIVNHLLREWTERECPQDAAHSGSRALTYGKPILKNRGYRPSVSDDEEDTTESEYEYSDSQSRGYYLEGPSSNGVKKNVRFKNQQARVEDGVDEEERRPRRPTRRHILNSDDDSSDSSLSPPKATIYKSQNRRDSNNSTGSQHSRYDPHQHASYDRNRRPYTAGPSGPRNSPPEKEAMRPGSSRGVPPSPRTGPMPMHNQPWPINTGHPPQGPGLRPPPQQYPSQSFPPCPPGPQRIPSNGNNPYGPQQYLSSPGASPVLLQGQYFPQQRRLSQGGGTREQRPASRPSRNSRQGSARGSSEKADKDKKNSSSRNLKKGIGIGAAAAGLMELLSGLEGI